MPFWEPEVAEVFARAKRDTASREINGEQCLIWQGALNSDGYPCMKVGGRTVLVTRWLLAKLVREFRKRELACHHCDRPACIEPEHLHHGSYSRNLRDSWHRKRRSRPTTFLAAS